MRCLASNPIVNGIESELEGTAEVVRVSLLSRQGREIGRRFEVSGAPTTLVLDGQGQVVYRHAGLPGRKAVIASVMSAAS